MDDLLYTQTTKQSLETPAPKPRTAGLLDLPPEIILEVSLSCSKHDIKAFRSVCKSLDTILHTIFGRRFFSRLHVLPTPTSLDLLNQISTHARLSPHVRELCLCSSIYQYWCRIGSRETRPGERRAPPRRRILSEDTPPFADPVSEEQEAVNLAVELVRGDEVQKQLTTALQRLRIDRIEVEKWPGCPSLALGCKQLMAVTQRDPFNDDWYSMRPDWDYEGIDMATRMTEIVFSAVRDSDTSLGSLNLDWISIDQLRLTPDLGNNLRRLRSLSVGIGKANQSLDLSDSEIRFEIFTLINQLPCLEDLSLSNCPSFSEDRLHLPTLLPHIHLPTVTKLCLGDLEDSSPQVVSFLMHSVPKLKDLELKYITTNDDNQAWKEMFMALRGGVAGLQRLKVDVHGRIHRAKDWREVDETLVWLAEKMPDL